MDKDYVTYSRIKMLIEKYRMYFKNTKDYQNFIKELTEILEI
jgi:hypothetical protein